MVHWPTECIGIDHTRGGIELSFSNSPPASCFAVYFAWTIFWTSTPFQYLNVWKNVFWKGWQFYSLHIWTKNKKDYSDGWFRYHPNVLFFPKSYKLIIEDMAGINMRSVQRWMSWLKSPVVLRAKVAFPCFVLLCNSCLCSGLGFSPFLRKSFLFNVYEVTASLSDIIVPLIFNNCWLV